MTKLLVRLFAGGDPALPKTRSKTGKLSGVIGMLCNALLCVMKLIVGTVSGSVSITADAMNNLSDAASSLVTLVGFRLAEKPADEDHPYGHARYEYLSGLAVAAMILLIGFELGKSSVEKIFHPAAVLLELPAVLVLVGAIAVKLWLCLFNRYLGKRIDSQALMATAADSRNDVISTAAVLAAMLVETLFSIQVDGYVGAAVAVFIFYSGITMAKETISPLLGETASPQLQKDILQVVCAQPRVLGYHDLMVHDYGPGQRFASIHVEMDEKENPLLCHELIDEIERICLSEHNVHLVIHYDPIVTGDPELDRLRTAVESFLKSQDSRITIHDFRMVKGQENTNLIFDMVLPHELMDSQKHLKKLLDEAINQGESMVYRTVITFDMASFNEEKG